MAVGQDRIRINLRQKRPAPLLRIKEGFQAVRPHAEHLPGNVLFLPYFQALLPDTAPSVPPLLIENKNGRQAFLHPFPSQRTGRQKSRTDHRCRRRQQHAHFPHKGKTPPLLYGICRLVVPRPAFFYSAALHPAFFHSRALPSALRPAAFLPPEPSRKRSRRNRPRAIQNDPRYPAARFHSPPKHPQSQQPHENSARSRQKHILECGHSRSVPAGNQEQHPQRRPYDQKTAVTPLHSRTQKSRRRESPRSRLQPFSAFPPFPAFSAVLPFPAASPEHRGPHRQQHRQIPAQPVHIPNSGKRRIRPSPEIHRPKAEPVQRRQQANPAGNSQNHPNRFFFRLPDIRIIKIKRQKAHLGKKPHIPALRPKQSLFFIGRKTKRKYHRSAISQKKKLRQPGSGLLLNPNARQRPIPAFFPAPEPPASPFTAARRFCRSKNHHQGQRHEAHIPVKLEFCRPKPIISVMHIQRHHTGRNQKIHCCDGLHGFFTHPARFFPPICKSCHFPAQLPFSVTAQSPRSFCPNPQVTFFRSFLSLSPIPP